MQCDPFTGQFNFYIADGTRYEELMLRLEKTASDLPLIVIENYDCFVRVIDFKNVIEKPGKLLELVGFDHQYRKEPIYLGHLIDDDEYHISGLFE